MSQAIAAKTIDRARTFFDNRWNYPGETTLYLAGDAGVALAEFARHLKSERPLSSPLTINRDVYRLRLHLECVLDLRDPACVAALSLDHAPNCFLDKNVARGTANFVRVTSRAQAILVPSVTLLDDPRRWIIVVFLEKMAPEPKRFIRAASPRGTFPVSI